MNPKQLSIYIDPKQSLNIYREELIGVFQNITLQHYNSQKHKITELTLHVKSHRAVLFHKTEKDLYFEIHYDSLKNEVTPIKRGIFSREVYKVQLVYRDKKVYELKYPTRQSFEAVFLILAETVGKSKGLVG
jgi:hypothetical protein